MVMALEDDYFLVTLIRGVHMYWVLDMYLCMVTSACTMINATCKGRSCLVNDSQISTMQCQQPTCSDAIQKMRTVV